jgi:hypothetical protein
MALNDFNFNPPEGWNNETEFPDYPQASEVRPLFQKLFDQIKVYLGLVKTEIVTHLADLVTDADGAHGLKTEEGTWTPVLKGLTTPGVNTYATQNGKYYKIGKQIIANFVIILSAKDAAMAGNIALDGLPFVIKSGAEFGASFCRLSYVDLSVGYSQISGYAPGAVSYMYLSQSGDNVANSILTANAITNNTVVTGSIAYLTN